MSHLRNLIVFAAVFLIAGTAQSATIGLFSTNASANAGAATATATAGQTFQILSGLTAADFAGIDVLWVLNSDNGSQPGDIGANFSAIENFVSAGGVFLYHDREVANAGNSLPGGSTINFTRDLNTFIDVINNTTVVTNGPGGIIDNNTLDGGNLSDHGYALDSSLPASTTKILSSSLASDVVDFVYPFGSGDVYYSSIPLDFYLAGAGSNTNFINIYAPNVLAYAGDLADENVAATPLPAALPLFLTMLAGMGFLRWRRRDRLSA
jgi:hypothetical protein